jgi:uncharacterized protein (TIGR02444 family)
MSALWDFSVKVYGADGVKDACLALQRAGLDVNMALWIAWLAHEGRDPAPALGRAMALSLAWKDAVVAPLRTARAALKAPPGFVPEHEAGALRRRVLDAELEAERMQQEALAELAARCPPTEGSGAKALCLERLADYAARLKAAGAPLPAFADTVFLALENR